MAAYAALVSVMHIIDDIQRHHSPPISLDQQQLQSLTQVVTSLQEFLEAYNSPFADGDGADPLEIRIADAAYAAEDVIQSHIVDEIHPQNQQTTSLADSDEPDLLEIHLQNRQTSSLASKISSFFNCFRAPKKPENVDDEQNKSISFRAPKKPENVDDEQIKGISFRAPKKPENVDAEQIKSISFRAPKKPENVEDEQIKGISFRAPKKPENVDAEQIKSINFYQDLQQVIDEMESINKEAMKIDTEKAVVVHDHDVSASAAPLRSFSSSSPMVCSDDVLHDALMEKLKGDCVDRQVISIVGMGGIGRSRGTNRQCRRVVIPRNTSKKKVREGMQSMPRARSHSRSVICEKWEVPPDHKFGLLSKFHVSKFRTFEDQSYMNSLAFQYANLRHLDVEVRSMSSFFSSITLFWNLHTLIVTCPYHYEHESTAPSEIWKMRQLRHIEFPEQRVRLPVPDPPSDMDEDIVIMENLRMLKGVKNLKCCEEVVKRIPNIKKLKLKYVDQLKDTMSDDYYCVSNIKSLSKLESLCVDCTFESRGASYPHKLSFPHSLKKLTLSMKTEFEWEEMLEKIGSLPCLEKLKLWMGCFGTGKWEIVEGPEEKFRNLKYLGLFYCKGLKQWTVEDSSVLPRLEQLHLYALKELEEIPRKIGEIPTLQKIRLLDCSESSLRSVKVLMEKQEEFHGEQLPFHVEVSLGNGRTEMMDRYIRLISGEEIKSDTSSD